MGEFELIARYFKRPPSVARALTAGDVGASGESGVALGIGDDCALLRLRPGTQLAVSSDMLVQGRHFFADADPAALGHKALAVNLSDLAACAAKPLAFTLALALPRVDEAWLAGFSSGLFALADAHGCTLMGGDTTQGPLNICITVFGEVPVQGEHSQALLRSGAKPGDELYVSGTLGDARMALEALRGSIQLPAQVLASARQRLEQPTPRVALGLALRGIATAAIDVSDGLLGDLGHILGASACGVTLNTSVAAQLMAVFAPPQTAQEPLLTPADLGLSPPQTLAWVLAGGDDYELLFTAPHSARNAVQQAARASATPITRVGRIDTEAGLRLVDAQGLAVNGAFPSFDHFA